MPKPKKAARFGGSPGHHNLMMANLATELFRYGRIRTTHAKAKTVQPIAERLVTLAKRGDLHSRRQVLAVIRDKDVVHRLFADIGPAFGERNGGYTRVLRLGPRKGDAAPMALIELVEDVAGAEATDAEGASRRRWSLRRRRGDDVAAAPSDDEPLESEAVDEGEMLDDEDVEEAPEAEERVAPAADHDGAVAAEIADADGDDDEDDDRA